MLKNHWNTLKKCLFGQTTKWVCLSPQNPKNARIFERWGLMLVAHNKSVVHNNFCSILFCFIYLFFWLSFDHFGLLRGGSEKINSTRKDLGRRYRDSIFTDYSFWDVIIKSLINRLNKIGPRIDKSNLKRLSVSFIFAPCLLLFKYSK